MALSSEFSHSDNPVSQDLGAEGWEVVLNLDGA
jgi:hypothetical protein